MRLPTILIVILVCSVTALAKEPVRICYYSNWSQYRPGIGKFLPTDIDPFLCTHLVYSFAKLTSQYTLTFYEWNDDVLYVQFNNLKKTNPDLKTLLAVGGWNAGSEIFSNMVSNADYRRTFARQTVEFLRQWDFDGFDLDWEYPALRGGRPSDKQNFIELIKDLKDEIATDPSTKPRLLLTAAVAAGKTNIDTAYDIPQMGMYLDYINLMSYDLHGAWEKTVGHNSPLYARSSETGDQTTLNMNWAAKYWVEKGAPRDKLVIGLATYGRSFRLSSAASYQMDASASGPGTAGPYTREAGFLAYYEICNMLAAGAQRYWEPEQQVPYLIQGDQWVGYDDEESIKMKLKYIKEEGYAGAMIWNIDLDDFKQICPSSSRRYPLMSLMEETLNNGQPQTTLMTTTATETPTTYVPVTTETPVETGPKRVCYYSNLAQYRHGVAKHMPANIDPFLCTHLIYSFAKLDTKSELSFSEWNDESLSEELNNLKKINPSLKTLLAVGGWNQGSRRLSSMANDTGLRQNFAKTAVTFLRKWDFDGLDINWEFPTLRGDRENFVALLKDLRVAFGQVLSSKQRLLLFAAVSADQAIIDAAYDINNMAMLLDFVTLMTYDLHGDWEGRLGHNSPLYAKSTDVGDDKMRNMDWAANFWVQMGFPREKLLLGLAAYGRSFRLSDQSSHGVGSPSMGPGSAGMSTKEPGFLAYYEVCQNLSSGAQRFWDVEQKVPHFIHGDMWVGYDDAESFTIKLNYIREAGFGGASVWNLGLDDFNQQCGLSSRPYPLISLMAEVLGGQNPNMHETSVTTWTEGNKNQSGTFTCSGKMDGYYSDPYDCSSSYQCLSDKVYERSCPGDLVWDEIESVCTYSEVVECRPVALPMTETTSPIVTTRKTTMRPTTTTTKRTTTTTTTKATTKAAVPSPTGTDCSILPNGLYPDPSNCHKYFECAKGQKYSFSCGSFLNYNPDIKNCDWPQKVTCPR